MDNQALQKSAEPIQADRTVVYPSLPGYQIHSELGKGGFATVYLATQMSLNRRVALKVMHPAYAADPELCERFIREGQDLAVVSEHDNIVTVYDVGHHRNLYYIAMQYLPGPTLKERLMSSKHPQQPLQIITGIAQALSFAHAKGYVHRDIKPANILFNSHGQAVLSDFGIAKTHNRDEQLTRMGQMIGTQSYMSPEQALMSADLDGRSDLYSLGVVFYETLTQRLPYHTTGSTTVLDQHLHAPIPELPESDIEFQPVLNRLMAKTRDERYRSADELLTDIDQRFFSPDSEPIQTSALIRRWPRLVLPGTLLLGLIILGVLGSILLPGASDTTLTRPLLSAADQSTVDDSLELAGLNELLGRVHNPPGSNAVELYTLVLELDPLNPEALSALTRLGIHRDRD